MLNLVDFMKLNGFFILIASGIVIDKLMDINDTLKRIEYKIEDRNFNTNK